jgi:hypothetical protein
MAGVARAVLNLRSEDVLSIIMHDTRPLGRAEVSVVVTRRRDPAIHRGIVRDRPSLKGASTMAAKKKAAKKKVAKKPAKKAAKKK